MQTHPVLLKHWETALEQENSILRDFVGVSSLDQCNINKIGMPPCSRLTRGVILVLFQTCEVQLLKEHRVKVKGRRAGRSKGHEEFFLFCASLTSQGQGYPG